MKIRVELILDLLLDHIAENDTLVPVNSEVGFIHLDVTLNSDPILYKSRRKEIFY